MIWTWKVIITGKDHTNIIQHSIILISLCVSHLVPPRWDWGINEMINCIESQNIA